MLGLRTLRLRLIVKNKFTATATHYKQLFITASCGDYLFAARFHFNSATESQLVFLFSFLTTSNVLYKILQGLRVTLFSITFVRINRGIYINVFEARSI